VEEAKIEADDNDSFSDPAVDDEADLGDSPEEDSDLDEYVCLCDSFQITSVNLSPE